MNYCRAALFCATSIARPFAPIVRIGSPSHKCFFFGSFLGKPTLQRFPIWINGLYSTVFDNGHFTNCGSILFLLVIRLKTRNIQNLRSFGPCTSTISIDSSRPFEVDSWKKLWILDLLPWFLRWTAFGQANLECRCWNKRKDSTCWIIFRWDYCFKTCNFFFFVQEKRRRRSRRINGPLHWRKHSKRMCTGNAGNVLPSPHHPMINVTSWA